MTSVEEVLELNQQDLTYLALQLGLDISSSTLRDETINVLLKRKGFDSTYGVDLPSSFHLSDLICFNLKTGTLGYVTEGACTKTGRRIIDNLIRVASTRIFVNPERSFIEPLANSVDAYRLLRGERPTGKFGMGFYSLFYYLLKNPGSTLSVISHPRNFPQYPWSIVIDSDLNVKFNRLEQTPGSVEFRVTLNIQLTEQEKDDGDSQTLFTPVK